MAVLKAINMGLSFILEIAMLVVFGYWCFQSVDDPWLRWVLAIGVPLLVIVLWGLFLAPRAGHRANRTIGIMVSMGLFYLASLALFDTGHASLGTAMLVVALINRALMFIWKQW